MTKQEQPQQEHRKLSRRAFFGRKSPELLIPSLDQSESPRAIPKTKDKVIDRPLRPLSITAGLEEWSPSDSQPWNRQRVAHLIRRTSLSASPERIDQVLQMDPMDAVDAIINGALTSPMPPVPEWENDGWPGTDPTEEEITAYQTANRANTTALISDWTTQLINSEFRDYMALFWHNSFVVSSDGYNAGISYKYLTKLRQFSLGNFKDFTRAIGLDQSMLLYLDGNRNYVNDEGVANENFARELLELFTMGILNKDGQPNYTENDIRELARAFTGYAVDAITLAVERFDWYYDSTEKTIFGQTGEWGYDDAIDIIFQERSPEIAWFICKKLYRFFVYEAENIAIIEEMTATLLANNFAIEPVVRQLLKSAHFFDSAVIGSKIKGPLELVLGMVNELALPGHEEQYNAMRWRMLDLGQGLLRMPNVAGWPGHRAWISTSSLPIRWAYMTALMGKFINEEGYSTLVIANKMSNPNNPYQLARDLAEFLIPIALSEEIHAEFVSVLLGSTPDYDWNIESDTASSHVYGLLIHLFNRPEFQLT